MAVRTPSNSRPRLALLLAVLGVAALPAAIAYSRYSSTFSLLDAAWLIPVAAVASTGALLRLRGRRKRVSLQAHDPTRTARWLAVAGLCLALAATISIGFYELLVRLEG